ncbi:MAG: aminotransferase class I/II-fold pyridoxal phosphate-dependent enzyme, partial [Candidatus Marinimicrobia bacterium]|nr:aminotransferase class I/II-fold pyridoxal phosphate-dependent enzyme [Candidatus Neomarinimicrobiota bacterium]
MVLPGAGRIQARPFFLDEPQDYTGRICYNENPLGPSPLALQALRDEAALAHRYPDWLNKNVESAVADHLGLDAEQVCVGAGATEMIQKVADAFVGPGDEVILAQPSYNQIATEAVANGGAAVYVPVDENHIIDLTAILAAITDNTKLIFLVNPNNPLGKFIHKDDMASFMDQIPEGIAVCVDEAYNEYVENEDYESSIPYISEGFPV